MSMVQGSKPVHSGVQGAEGEDEDALARVGGAADCRVPGRPTGNALVVPVPPPRLAPPTSHPRAEGTAPQLPAALAGGMACSVGEASSGGQNGLRWSAKRILMDSSSSPRSPAPGPNRGDQMLATRKWFRASDKPLSVHSKNPINGQRNIYS